MSLFGNILQMGLSFVPGWGTLAAGAIGAIDQGLAADAAQNKANKMFNAYALPEMNSNNTLRNSINPLINAYQTGDMSNLPPWLKEISGAYDMPVQAQREQRLGQLRTDLAGRGLFNPGMTSSYELGGLTGIEHQAGLDRVNASRTNKADIMQRLAQLYSMRGQLSNRDAAMKWSDMYQNRADNLNNTAASGFGDLAQMYGTLQGMKTPIHTDNWGTGGAGNNPGWMPNAGPSWNPDPTWNPNRIQWPETDWSKALANNMYGK